MLRGFFWALGAFDVRRVVVEVRRVVVPLERDCVERVRGFLEVLGVFFIRIVTIKSFCS